MTFAIISLTSNVSSFCLLWHRWWLFLTFLRPHVSFVVISACGVAHIVVCHMFLCVVRRGSSTIILWHNFDMEEELLHSPRLPNSPIGLLQILQCMNRTCCNDEECGLFSDLDVGLLLHLHQLLMQRHQSDCGSYLANESYELCKQPLLQVKSASILVTAYHCAARKLQDPSSWYPLIGATTLWL